MVPGALLLGHDGAELRRRIPVHRALHCDHDVLEPAGEPERRYIALAYGRPLLPTAGQPSTREVVAGERDASDVALTDDFAVDEQLPAAGEIFVGVVAEDECVSPSGTGRTELITSRVAPT